MRAPATEAELPATSAPANGSPVTSLAARGICRRLGARAVLEDVDLVRDRVGLVGLVGPNGAGKTTLLRILAQLMEADAGTIDIAGRRVERGDDPTARRLVGWAPHQPLAWLDEDAEQNLRYAGRLAGLDRRHARTAAAAAIERWSLATVAGQPVRQLSRGWQQRYGLARADLLAPPVLLLDEPTTGLDAQAREALDDALERWRHTRVVVMATHERAWLTDHADQLLELRAPGAAT